jgi:hypothetical protein
MQRLLQRALGLFGVALTPASASRLGIVEASERDAQIMAAVRPYTMTSPERIWALVNSVQYISANAIAGDLCECGVWRGGSSMAAALKLAALGERRRLWLYDTFAGMAEPGELDRSAGNGAPALREWQKRRRTDAENEWCLASLEDVRRNLATTGHPPELLSFVAGKVEETLRVPANVPSTIALLRLDTDWYESTKVELEVLYERLSPGGVLIIDDYGHWEGARRAVDQFFAARPLKMMLLNRIDYTGRIGIKPG